MDHIEAIYYLHLYFVFYNKNILDRTGHGFMPEIIFLKKEDKKKQYKYLLKEKKIERNKERKNKKKENKSEIQSRIIISNLISHFIFILFDNII